MYFLCNSLELCLARVTRRMCGQCQFTAMKAKRKHRGKKRIAQSKSLRIHEMCVTGVRSFKTPDTGMEVHLSRKMI